MDIDGEYPEDFPKLPSLASVKTSRGVHYYFFYPEKNKIKSRNKLNGADIEIKSDGGYVVAPPSVHPSGGRYEFINT